MSINFNNLENLLNKLQLQGEKPEKILIGYKAYGVLMGDRKFANEVAGSAMDPNKRKFKNIKIKVTQDEYQLEIKCVSNNNTRK